MSFSGLTGGSATTPFGVVLIARDARAAEQAIAQAGGRIVAACAWDAAAGVLDAAPAAVLAIDLRGASDGPGPGLSPGPEAARFPDAGRHEREGGDLDLAGVLTDLVADAVARGVAPVVVVDTPQIDLLAGAIFAGPAQLLCEPSHAEWVLALAVAGRGIGAARAVREGERERIAELTRRMAALAQELAGLIDREGEADRPADAVADRRRGFGAPPGDMAAIDAAAVDPAAIRAVLRARRLRDRDLGAGLFEDPAWDMLLDLFAAALEGGRVSVSSLCIAAAVAPTTALRWIARLAEAGLVEREPDARDRRRIHVALSAEARARMGAYVGAVARAGLPFV